MVRWPCQDWQRRCQLKQHLYQSLAYFYMGQTAEEQHKYGEQVAWFSAASQRCSDAAKSVKELKDTEETIKFVMDVVEGKYRSSKKDNDFVYHDRVPEFDKLSEINGATLVKGVPFEINDPEVCGADIFHRLVPMATHEASSIYSEKKASLLREMGAEIEKKNEELGQVLASLQLDPACLVLEDPSLPQELYDCCARMSITQDVGRELTEKMQELAGISVDVESGLKELGNIIKAEEEDSKLFTATYGPDTTDSHHQQHVGEISQNYTAFTAALDDARPSNDHLREALRTHLPGIRTISQPLELIRQGLPTVTSLRDSETEFLLGEARNLLDKVHEMRIQRQYLQDELRKGLLSDDVTKILLAAQNRSQEEVFADNLKKHESTLNLIRLNLTAQENIIQALIEQNAKMAPKKLAISEIREKRSTQVNDLIKSYESYQDLMVKCEEGKRFYTQLHSKVIDLQAAFSDVVKANQERRKAFLAKLQPKGPPPPRPIQPRATPEPAAPELSANHTPLPTDAGAPKLRDYLAAMKPNSFGHLAQDPGRGAADAQQRFSPNPLGLYGSQQATGAAHSSLLPSPYANYSQQSTTPSLAQQQRAPTPGSNVLPPSSVSHGSFVPSAPSASQMSFAVASHSTSQPTFSGNHPQLPAQYPQHPSVTTTGFGFTPFSQSSLPQQSSGFAAPPLPQTSYSQSSMTYAAPQTLPPTTQPTSFASYPQQPASVSFPPQPVSYPQRAGVPPGAQQPVASAGYLQRTLPPSAVQPTTSFPPQQSPFPQTAPFVPQHQFPQQSPQIPFAPPSSRSHVSGPYPQQPPVVQTTTAYAPPFATYTQLSSQSPMGAPTSGQHPLRGQQPNPAYPHQEAMTTQSTPFPPGAYLHQAAQYSVPYSQPYAQPPLHSVPIVYGQPQNASLMPDPGNAPRPPQPAATPQLQQPPYTFTQPVPPSPSSQAKTIWPPPSDFKDTSSLSTNKHNSNPATIHPSTSDLLSSSPVDPSSVGEGNSHHPPPPALLTPRVITQVELDQQKEEERLRAFTGAARPQPLNDPLMLNKFIAEAERLIRRVNDTSGPGGTNKELADEWTALLDAEKTWPRKSTAIARCYPLKNRNQDNVPFDENRVVLKDSKDDYINASHIDLQALDASCCPRFVAGQAPLPTTLSDFWTLLFEQGCEVVAFLSKPLQPDEKDKLRLVPHWPDTKGAVSQMGHYEISLQAQKDREAWTERVMNVRHRTTHQTRSLVHFHYHDVSPKLPQSVESFIAFLNEVHGFYRQQRSLIKPIAVFCSTGCGLSGLFIATSAALLLMERNGTLRDLADIVGHLWRQRRWLLDDRQQLAFAYKALAHAAADTLIKRNIVIGRGARSSNVTAPLTPSQPPPHRSTSISGGGGVATTPTSGVTSLVDSIFSNQTVQLADLHSAVERWTVKRNSTHGQQAEDSPVPVPAGVCGDKQETPGTAGMPSSNEGGNKASRPALTNLPPSLRDLEDPAKLQLNPLPPDKRRPTRRDFELGSSSRSGAADSDDPFRALDPLWAAESSVTKLPSTTTPHHLVD